MAYLSQTLVRIDTDADISVDLEDCRICLPFPAEAKEICFRLEFSSIMRMDIFAEGEVGSAEKSECKRAEVVRIHDSAAFIESVMREPEIAVYSNGVSFAFYFGGIEYTARLKSPIFWTTGWTKPKFVEILKAICGERERRLFLYGKKNMQHRLAAISA